MTFAQVTAKNDAANDGSLMFNTEHCIVHVCTNPVLDAGCVDHRAGLLVIGFVWRLLRFRRELLSDAECPRGAVILCLRGGDPFLRNCVAELLNQDYPNFEVHVIVDHPDDPANAILDELLAETGSERVHVKFLKDPLDTCSLKCSSVVQAVRSLDESVDFIAQLDADTIPHATWLRELATAAP